jgi:hypothetical protein
MSNFLFGQFFFRGPLTPAEEIRFGIEATRAALAQEFGLQLGVNITQGIPFDVLGIERNLRQPAAMPFLIVDYPTTDVSECLIAEDGSTHTSSGWTSRTRPISDSGCNASKPLSRWCWVRLG